MDLVEAGGRTLQSKRNTVTRSSKIGEYRLQFDWKLGEPWEREKGTSFAWFWKALNAQ